MTMTMYLYDVWLSGLDGSRKEIGWIIAKHGEMPFKEKMYGIFGMTTVLIFGISMEVLA